ncbi:MAG: hypothetical protein HUU54_12440 [Ignavibacteriaceae bacterium]|nr:hypothetical protein [Ignavibacteriaceae bacterium]
MQQSFLALVALAILTTLSLNFNSTTLNQTTASMNTEGIITATGAGQSLIEEVKVKAYDEATVSAHCSTTAGLTNPASLGPDAGETNVNLFDDVDDFDNYSTTVATSRLGNFNVRSKVYYIDYNYPDVELSAQSFTKRVDVTVTNQYMTDTVNLFIIIGY